jgi:threonine dehydrogenase-like Zn-dependent dehydrogenase
MKAIAVVPGTRSVRLVERPEPTITTPTEVKVKILRVGICGTDREEAAGGRSRPPEGSTDLVMGHEMLGRVVEVGSAVTRVHPGDLAVFTVRRGCGACLPCRMNRSDMCLTGNFTERGIWGRDGYECEIAVDDEQYIVRLPPELEGIGVLTEPTSVVEKAIDEAVRIQTSRLPDAGGTPDWLFGKRCLVAGLGPIGLLGAMVLVLRGADVYGLDIVDAATARPQWLTAIGGRYIDGRKIPADKVDDVLGPMDVILEAAGIASLDFDLLDALATNGIFVLTGIPGGDRPIQVSGASVMSRLVLRNQVMVGSVNAARDHFGMAVRDLTNAQLRWKDHLPRLITPRHASADFAQAFGAHPADEIKAIIEWSNR